MMIDRLRELLLSGSLDLPALGEGATAARWRALHDLAREDVALARVAEAHVDARQILREAGRGPAPDACYGVWASEDPSRPSLQVALRGKKVVLCGVKTFCTGAGALDHALVTAHLGEGVVLLDLDLKALEPSLSIDHSGWASPAFAETATAVVTFDAVEVGAECMIGGPNWYFERARFWDAACGPAACWAGGAAGLVQWAGASTSRSDVHQLVALGALQRDNFSMAAALDAAGRAIDGDNTGTTSPARLRALQVRESIALAADDIVQLVQRAYGPRPLAFDRDVLRRIQHVQLYIRQSHGDRDLAAIGQLVLDQ